MKRSISILLLGVIILGACALRINTFWLPHFSGDEGHYITLAFKLEKFGFEKYNFKGVGFMVMPLARGMVKVNFPALYPDPDSEGMLLPILRNLGMTSYDVPFIMLPPGFPCALIFSHMIFLHADCPYTFLTQDLTSQLCRKKPLSFIGNQFYAAIVPFFWSILTICGVYFLGRILFSAAAGVWAAFIMAVNALDLLTSQRIWADDQTMFFVLLSAIFYVISRVKGKRYLSFMAGVFCGIAWLTKYTAGFYLAGLLMYVFLDALRRPFSLRSVMDAIRIRELYLIGLGFLCVVAFWHYQLWKVYHTLLPFFSIDMSMHSPSPYVQRLLARPHSVVLFPIITFVCCPPIALSLFTLKRCVDDARTLFGPDTGLRRTLFLWMLISVNFIILCALSLREERYFLPMHPFLAVAAGAALHHIFTEWQSRRISRPVIRVLVGIFIIASVGWSVRLGLLAAISGTSLITVPF